MLVCLANELEYVLVALMLVLEAHAHKLERIGAHGGEYFRHAAEQRVVKRVEPGVLVVFAQTEQPPCFEHVVCDHLNGAVECAEKTGQNAFVEAEKRCRNIAGRISFIRFSHTIHIERTNKLARCGGAVALRFVSAFWLRCFFNNNTTLLFVNWNKHCILR